MAMTMRVLLRGQGVLVVLMRRAVAMVSMLSMLRMRGMLQMVRVLSMRVDVRGLAVHREAKGLCRALMRMLHQVRGGGSGGWVHAVHHCVLHLGMLLHRVCRSKVRRQMMLSRRDLLMLQVATRIPRCLQNRLSLRGCRYRGGSGSGSGGGNARWLLLRRLTLLIWMRRQFDPFCLRLVDSAVAFQLPLGSARRLLFKRAPIPIDTARSRRWIGILIREGPQRGQKRVVLCAIVHVVGGCGL